MDEIILKYALQNAIKFNGKANPNAVIGKIIQENPDSKSKIPEIKKILADVLKDIEKLSVEEQRKKLEEIAPELLEEKVHEKRRGLPALKNAVDGKVVMRFEPSPSGPLHVGHAYVLGLNSEYCRIYNGKMILRIGDTNPNNIYEPAYRLIKEDADWVTMNNISEFMIQSDRMEIYYSYIEKLLEVEKVYICDCNVENYKDLLLESKPCPCRELSKAEQFSRWKRMLSQENPVYKEGEAVARLKTDLSHKNPAMRDFALFRIVENSHARQGIKYRVWPLMNMSVAADDIESGVTHAIRAKDHYDNALKQKYIYEYLNKQFPETIFVGRINFTGLLVSCTQTRKLIEAGEFESWEDVRLPFLQALKKRGYMPEAFIKYAVDVGVTTHDKSVSKDEFFKTIDAFNRDVIDGKSYRYFFVHEPVEIKIENAPQHDVELDLHPDNKKGGRKFSAHENFVVAKEDFEKFADGKLYRLMDCVNFRKENGKLIFDSLDYYVFKEKGSQIIHWLPKSERNISVEILMPDNSRISGIAEENIGKLFVGTVVQFARFGFCRLDEIKDGKFVFMFGHK